jgi:hypothetical protein
MGGKIRGRAGNLEQPTNRFRSRSDRVSAAHRLVYPRLRLTPSDQLITFGP